MLGEQKSNCAWQLLQQKSHTDLLLYAAIFTSSFTDIDTHFRMFSKKLYLWIKASTNTTIYASFAMFLIDTRKIVS